VVDVISSGGRNLRDGLAGGVPAADSFEADASWPEAALLSGTMPVMPGPGDAAMPGTGSHAASGKN
jgi:hypothetical protein